MLPTITSMLLSGLLLVPAAPRFSPQEDGFVEVTVPTQPDSTVIHLTSASPATLLETRSVRLERGLNRLRFDWSSERIDEASVRFEVAAAAGTAKVVSRRKVQRLGKLLYYDVEASEDSLATLSTHYLLHGIGWRVDYVGLLSEDLDAAGAGSLSLKLRVEVHNNSGLDLEHARVSFEGGLLEDLSLKNSLRRQVDVFRLDGIPITRRYLWDPSRYGGTPRIEFEVQNLPEGPLGRELLPAGKIRVFKATQAGGPALLGPALLGPALLGPALLGEDVFPSTPLGEKAKFSIGQARDLVVQRTVLSQNNENERRDRWNKVVAYDQRAKVKLEIDCGLPRDTKLILVEKPGAPMEIVSCNVAHKQKQADTVEIEAELKAGQKTIVEIEWVRKNLF